MVSKPLASAIQDFQQARRRAALEGVLTRLTGRPNDLLSYEDVRRKLKGQRSHGERLEEIPLDAIVGSVGRYSDFTRRFLPREAVDGGRWARVEQAMTGMEGVPPIKVYQVGEAYFVRDGHHRVSVARQLGATHIEAYVTEVDVKVPLSPDVQPEDLILKAEYADFLERTHLDDICPEVDLTVTALGQYPILEEHIEVHRYFMGLEQEREIPYNEAAAHWCDYIYQPIVHLIRQRGLLRDFPERTETDLYLWIAEHRAELEEWLGWEIGPEAAADDLAERFGAQRLRIAARVGERLRNLVTPGELEGGPPPGRWREKRVTPRPDDRLFSDVLVALNGGPLGWRALDQALAVARREGGRVHGLHVIPSERDEASEVIQDLKAEFDRRLAEAGVTGELAIEQGEVPRAIAERARWVDLVVLSLAYPPAPDPLARLGSGFRAVIRNSPRPVLAVPESPAEIESALLAYDGSPKADEALFVATYLAGRWELTLTVVTVRENNDVTSETLANAREYLEDHGVEAEYIAVDGSVTGVLLAIVRERAIDWIVMGGYGAAPMLEVVLGSTVNRVLREGRRPMLICR
jgi:nucleotide-binding universal stress UspA family protein